jgi:glutathione synthase/RimK-type ligase-like ATP-grasp enzyme
MVRHLIRYSNEYLKMDKNCGSNSSKIYTILKVVFNILIKTPMNKEIFAYQTEGSLYNALYLFKKLETKKIIRVFSDKLSTNKLLLEHNIPCPKLFQFSDENGYWNCINPLESDTEFIIKPRYGCLGNGIMKKKGKDIFSIHSPNLIVQEYLNDCDHDSGSRHYRIISLFNGELFDIIQCSTFSKKEITSNYGNSLHFELMEVDLELQKIITKLCNFHQKLYSSIISIGWDVILHCKDGKKYPYVLEGNIPHAVIYPTTNKNKLNKYITMVSKFYN